MNAPAGGRRDQQGQDGSENQDGLGLEQARLRGRFALLQQAQLFVPQMAKQVLILIHEPLALSASNGIRRGVEAVGPAQGADCLRELDLPGRQRFEGGKTALLLRVIGGQRARVSLVLLQARDAGLVGLQIGFIPTQGKSAAARFDALHCDDGVLEAGQNLVGVPHPAVACRGLVQAAIGERTHGHQDPDSGPEREPHAPTQPGPGLDVLTHPRGLWHGNGVRTSPVHVGELAGRRSVRA